MRAQAAQPPGGAAPPKNRIGEAGPRSECDEGKASTAHRILIAGVGNIFFGDDGFGVEVAQRLVGERLPDGVEAADFGIRGVHLAYQLLDGYHALVLVDAAARGEEPGTVTVVEIDPDSVPDGALIDAHSLDPAAVLAQLRSLGGRVDRVLLVACEPVDTNEGIGLSTEVAKAVPDAVNAVVETVVDLVHDLEFSTVKGAVR